MGLCSGRVVEDAIIDCNDINDYDRAMASITIRRLGDDTKQRLRVRAAQHGRSMEDEARVILRSVLSEDVATGDDLAARVQRRFEAIGGLDLELPAREAVREPPKFG